MSWDLIGISKWARKEGGKEEGKKLLKLLRDDITEFAEFGKTWVE